MNFYERELQRLFGDERIIRSLRFGGPVCWGALSGDLYVKARLTCTKTAYEYDALEITVLNPSNEPLDTTLLKFQDVWGIKPVPPESGWHLPTHLDP